MASELKLSFEFDRYVNGTLMAEGVTIERASTLDKAMVAAARIAPKGPNGETPVLVYRPAPAATDTGLETVAKVDSHLGDMSRLSIIDRPLSIGTEVCLRSQAEELLAAERGKKEMLAESLHIQIKRVNELEADNAAKDARINELESKLETATALVTCCCGDPVDAHNMGSGHSPVDQYHYTMMQLEAKLETYHEEYENRKEGYEKTIDSLEAKLTAAEKAARAAHDTLIEINPSNYNHDDVCQLNDASVEAIFLLADILGETHGKTKEWWDERRAVLAGK